MKILYLLTRNRDATVDTLITGQQKEHRVTIVDLRTEKDFEQIVRQIDEAEQVICW